MRIDTQVIPKRGSFRYIGSIIHGNGVMTMLQSYWSGMDEMEACIWCSCPMRMYDQDLKGKFSRVAARQAMSYGSERRLMKN